MFDAVRHDMNIYRVENLNDCLQPNLQCPSVSYHKREEFERDYAKYSFVYVAKKYGDIAGDINREY